jgi:hypothetical protein
VRPELRLLLGGRHHLYLYDLKVVRLIKTYYTRTRVLRTDPDTVAAPVQCRADPVNTPSTRRPCASSTPSTTPTSHRRPG